MIAEQDILVKSIDFVTKTLNGKSEREFYYHNLEHTQEVVKAAIEIGKNSGLDDREMHIVQVSAWFHDVGYMFTCEDHENKGAQVATEFLEKEGLDEEFIRLVRGCILATRMPQNPRNLLEEVICDADLYHIATDKFFPKGENLKKEWEDERGEPFDQLTWLTMTIDFLKGQTYFTSYAQEKLEEGKNENLKKIKKELKALKKDSKEVKELIKENEKLKKKVDQDIMNRPTRGIETMFRITSKNHLQLSAMADNKANIMISINTIIISIIVSVLIRKLEEYPHFVIPVLMLVTVNLVTIVFSVLATRPNVSRGKFTRDDINNKKTNLLFFGNFHSMNLNDYLWGMKEMMKDGDFLYGSLIKDIYFLGAVLGKKYRYLRIAYTVFMYGLILSVLGFLLAEFLVRVVYVY